MFNLEIYRKTGFNFKQKITNLTLLLFENNFYTTAKKTDYYNKFSSKNKN